MVFARHIVRVCVVPLAWTLACLSGPATAAQLVSETVSIIGRVENDSGRPVRSAAVGILVTADIERKQREQAMADVLVRTDANGHFELRLPPDLGKVTVIARQTGYVPAMSVPLDLKNTTVTIGALIMKSGLEITGRVTAEGRPLPRSSVRAAKAGEVPDTLGRSGELPTATADRAGFFRLKGLSSGKYRLHVDSAGYVEREPLYQIVENADVVRPVNVELVPASRIAGQVVDNAGRPVPGAAIEAQGRLGERVATTSDELGNFRLGPLARGGRFEVRALAPEFGEWTGHEIASPQDMLRIVLTGLGAIRGQVIDESTGQPIRDFELTLSAPGAPQVGKTLSRRFHAADGQFTWQGLEPGVWSLSAGAIGYEPADITGIVVSSGASANDLPVALRKGSSLRGSVRSKSSGEPIPQARIQIEHYDTSATAQRMAGLGVTTDTHGEFTLPRMPATRFRLVARAAGYRDAYLDVDTQARKPVILEMVQVSSIAGRIVLADRVTPAIGQVRFSRIGSRVGVTRSTDAEGRFRFDLAPGRYLVSADSPRGRPDSQEIRLTEGQVITDLLIVLLPGEDVSGTITGLLPAEGRVVSIELRDEQRSLITIAQSSATGEYLVQGLPRGKIRIGVSTTLNRRLERQVSLPLSASERVDFAFPQGARVTGTVTRKGVPAEDVEIEARSEDPESFSASGRSAASGAFTLEGLPYGQYVITADHVTSKSMRVEGDTTVHIELPGLSIAGVVLDPSNRQPRANVNVELRSVGAHDSTIVRTTSDGAGRFVFEDVEPGAYELIAYKGELRAKPRLLEVRASVPQLVVALESKGAQ